MNNKYIGKRYSPKHCGTWDNTKNTAYESLTVLLWCGDSYTTTQDVPVGIDITNTLFFVKSGDYNAQVQIYKDDVDQFKLLTTQEINDINESLGILLYKPPIISLLGNPISGVYKYGQSISPMTLNLAITKLTNDITQINYKRNGIVIRTNNTPSNSSDSYVDNVAIVDNTTFLATVFDGKTTTTSGSIILSFVYQMFSGAIAKNIVNPTIANVQALTQIVKTKQNIVQPFTLTDQKGVFSYPTSYGDLVSIIDVNGFDITSSFIKTVLNIAMDDSSVVSYNVYTMQNSTTVTGYNITFKF